MTLNLARMDDPCLEHAFAPLKTESLKKSHGTYGIEMHGSMVGTVDVASTMSGRFVTVELVDTFLSIEEYGILMDCLRNQFNLPSDQKISIIQV